MSSPKPPTDIAADIVERHGATLLHHAAETIDFGLKYGRPPDIPPRDISESEYAVDLTAHHASFITLKKKGKLRGCVGTAEAWRPLVADVVANAFNAAFHDNRFPPLTEDERAHLDISLSLLGPPEKMAVSSEAELLAQLRPMIDGLIIADGRHNAIFLPQVWESFTTAEDFVQRLKVKAGLASDHWSKTCTAQRFTAISVSMTAAGKIRCGEI